MFWVMMYMWLSGGTPPPELSIIPDEQLFREVILDSPRLKDVLEIREEVNQLERELFAATAARDAELVRLAGQHDSGRKQFRAAFSELDRTRLAAQQSRMEFRFRLRELLTREEWVALYKNP